MDLRFFYFRMMKYLQLFFPAIWLSHAQISLGHSRGDNLTNPIFLTVFIQFRPEGHQECRNEVGPLRSVKRQIGFEPGTFRF